MRNQSRLPLSARGRRAISGFLAITAAVAVAACGTQANRQHAATKPTTSHKTTVIDQSYATSYASLAQLRQDATSVALIKPTATTSVETLGDVPWTITTVSVQKTLAGPALPATLGLRQAGQPGDTSGSEGDVGTSPLVSTNSVYIAYLQPFRMSPTGPAVGDQYVTIGGLQGLFQDISAAAPSSPSTPAFTPVDPQSSTIPSTVSLLQAQSS